MLHSFARHVATDADVAATLANLVHFVEVHNATLTAIQVLTALEVQLQGEAEGTGVEWVQKEEKTAGKDHAQARTLNRILSTSSPT